MIEHLDIEGHFWRDDPENTFRGRLRYEDGAIYLKAESLVADKHGELLGPRTLISGRSFDGRDLSLVNTFTTRMTIASRREQFPETILVNRLVIGSNDPDPVVRLFRIDATHLLEFLSPRGMEVKGGETAADAIELHWNPSAETKVAEAHGFKVSFPEEHVLDSGERHSVSLSNNVELQVEAAGDPRRISEFDFTSAIALRFVDFFLGYPGGVRRTYGFTPVSEQLVEVLAPQKDIGDSETVWIRLPALGDSWLDAFPNWMTFVQEHEGVRKILFEYLIFGGRFNLVDRFLYLARFVEIYHRLRFPATKEVKAEHKARVKKIVEQVECEVDQQWLKSVLGEANRAGMKPRLQQLIDSFDGGLDPMLGPDGADFAQLATQTRNYYTHFSESLRAAAADGADLHRLWKRMQIIMRACVLREMGYSNHDVVGLLKFDNYFDALERLK